MAFSRGAKHPIGILYSWLGGSKCSGHGYSTLANKHIPVSGVEVKQITSSTPKYAQSISAPGTFLRKCTATASGALCLAKLALLVEASSQQVTGPFPIAPEHLEDLKLNLDHPKLSGEKTVKIAVTELAAIMGENVRLRRGVAMSKTSPGILSTYLHSSLGRIAGILSLEVDDQHTSFDSLLHIGSELAMHVVAAKPLFITKELVSSASLVMEPEILKSQAEASGKSQMAIEKIVE
ncbi:hypothetical protein Nepgr_001082 [Nepenthes gracilis]|uniref:Elongation factor Ts, mitochondrial n=1 Tax=Nepenthes gracilis TaxID=150966 RepID=A0AAD3P6F6_NEPGR|nr:hypothetical protein Nepgr_001082 [Nepenthes gracilis]